MTSAMSDTDMTLRNLLRQGQGEAERGRDPGFETVWAAAKARASVRRKHGWVAGGAVAAAVLAVITVGLLSPAEHDWQYVNPAEFESSTSWVAPSDVLLPEHQFDIYSDIPVLIESTMTEEGALL